MRQQAQRVGAWLALQEFAGLFPHCTASALSPRVVEGAERERALPDEKVQREETRDRNQIAFEKFPQHEHADRAAAKRPAARPAQCRALFPRGRDRGPARAGGGANTRKRGTPVSGASPTGEACSWSRAT